MLYRQGCRACVDQFFGRQPSRSRNQWRCPQYRPTMPLQRPQPLNQRAPPEHRQLFQSALRAKYLQSRLWLLRQFLWLQRPSWPNCVEKFLCLSTSDKPIGISYTSSVVDSEGLKVRRASDLQFRDELFVCAR